MTAKYGYFDSNYAFSSAVTCAMANMMDLNGDTIDESSDYSDDDAQTPDHNALKAPMELLEQLECYGNIAAAGCRELLLDLNENLKGFTTILKVH
jgi:hypothetical protein